MSKEILIHIEEGERRVAILESGKLDDFYIEVDRNQSILGNIYKGKVESILPSINGAFVNIGQEKNGFLYLPDAVNPLVEEDLAPPAQPQNLIDKILHKHDKPENTAEIKQEPKPDEKAAEQKPEQNSEQKSDSKPKPHHRPDHRRRGRREHEKPATLTQGQEIMVQVVKEPFANKGARLTTHITLAGRFVVYMPFDKQAGVSKKIESQEERQRLKEVLKEFTFAKSGGFIVRTASLSQNKKDLIRDAKFLVTIWQRIQKLSEEKKAPALIYKEYDLIWKIVRDFLTDNVEKLIIDSQEDFIRLKKFVFTLIGRHMLPKIHLYKANVPLFDAKNVAHELSKIYDTRINLKSGASIVIEPTEGLTVVDVNSGKFRTKASPEDAAFMVNMEAAPEIARQLRLRDLGGIIVIDFIDMTKEGHKKKVLEVLQEALSRDHAKTEVNRISSLGLVEMTRARSGKTIESISFSDCPYCEGRGRVKIR